jgi:hypothetical protein
MIPCHLRPKEDLESIADFTLEKWGAAGGTLPAAVQTSAELPFR